jgi:hypothetical protein
MTTAKAPTKTTTTTASADAREAPTMKSSCLDWDVPGHRTRSAFVNLPQGMIAEDVGVPEVWRNIQQNPQSALQKFDRVTCVAADQTWMLKDLVVIEADGGRVVLNIRPGDFIRLTGRAK